LGADPLMGDGAGMLVQIPDRLFREEMSRQGLTCLPENYAVGFLFHAAGRGPARSLQEDHRRCGRRRRPGAARFP
jgi:glutamate synthase (NADPH/NADH) large chain